MKILTTAVSLLAFAGNAFALGTPLDETSKLVGTYTGTYGVARSPFGQSSASCQVSITTMGSGDIQQSKRVEIRFKDPSSNTAKNPLYDYTVDIQAGWAFSLQSTPSDQVAISSADGIASFNGYASTATAELLLNRTGLAAVRLSDGFTTGRECQNLQKTN